VAMMNIVPVPVTGRIDVPFTYGCIFDHERWRRNAAGRICRRRVLGR
jgi:hypothetical protein